MRKIYFIRANQTKFGGAEVYLSRLARVLSEQGVPYKIVHSSLPKFLPSWLRIIFFNFKVCLAKGGKFYFSLDRVICPDVYRSGDGVHKKFLELERKSKWNLLHPVYLYIEQRCYQRAKKIIAISNMVKQDIVSSYQIDQEKIQVVYNGIELKEFDYQESFQKVSNEFHIDKNGPIISYVGSGFKRKGVEEFLYIVSQIKTPGLRAFVVGKEKNIQHYEYLSKKLEISDKVFFTGPRTDVEDFYAVSDIFLFPTHYEPFGSVVLEAMNLGNVVFTTRQCGAGELLDDYFLMNGSADYSVISKIEDLLNDRARLNNLKEDNIAISKNFSIESNLAKTLEVMDDLID